MLYDAAGMSAVFWLAAATLAVELIMLFLLIERKAAATAETESCDEPGADAPHAHEETPLLPGNLNGRYKIEGEFGRVIQALPVLYCFRESRLLMALVLAVVQGSIIGVFDATVPTEAASLFHFSSLKAGLLFTALILPYIGLGPVAGMAVDKYGTKMVATYGYALLTPSLAVLGIPSQHFITGMGNIFLFCAILAVNGAALSIVGSPSFVEASDVTFKYETANPGFFGENGPYAQIFGFNSLCFFLGLTIGPLVGGALRDSFGYEVMGLVFAAVSGISAVLSYVYIGEKPNKEAMFEEVSADV